MIISVLNQKGGVGKTTTVINLGAYLARSGKSVLVVDFDPQGNATSGLGIDKQMKLLTIYDVLVNDKSAADVILSTREKNLHILPANANLSATDLELAEKENREYALKSALSGLQYDYILIDCPPSLGLLTVNALVASDSLMIPVQAEFYALEGLTQLLEVMQKVKNLLNPDLQLLGILVTMYDNRNSLAKQVYEELEKYFGDKVFGAIVPRNVRLAEAPSYGKTIAEHDKWSKGAKAYKQLSKEVIKRVG